MTAVTPDRPSIEAEIAALERAARISEEDGPTVANNRLLVAAREALLSRFLEQQAEMLTPEEARECLEALDFTHGIFAQSDLTAKLRRIAAIQPGGTPQK